MNSQHERDLAYLADRLDSLWAREEDEEVHELRDIAYAMLTAAVLRNGRDED